MGDVKHPLVLCFTERERKEAVAKTKWTEKIRDADVVLVIEPAKVKQVAFAVVKERGGVTGKLYGADAQRLIVRTCNQ